MKDKIFIVPENDLESVEIIKILESQGYTKGVDLFITQQQWGASWDGLEPEIKDALKRNAERTREDEVEREPDTPITFDTKGRWTVEEYDKSKTIMYGGHLTKDRKEYTKEGTHREYLEFEEVDPGWDEGHVVKKSGFQRETFLEKVTVPDYVEVIGVELKGKPPYEHCTNIDHHRYEDRDENGATIVDDRTKGESSLEQIAKMFDIKLSLEQKFIASNDRGFVEEMQKTGKQIRGMLDSEISEMIKQIRMQEHAILARVQGITPEMEQQAEEAIANARKLENGTLVVNLPHSKCATVTDRIPEQEYNGGLLIICGDGEIDYYGSSKKVEEMFREFGGWTGNTAQEYTFFGTTERVDMNKLLEIADRDEIETLISESKEKREQPEEKREQKGNLLSRILSRNNKQTENEQKADGEIISSENTSRDNNDAR